MTHQPLFRINHTHPCVPCTLSRLLLPTLSLVVNLLHLVNPFTVRFAEDMPVARLPVLGKDRVVTIPIAGQARRVKAVHEIGYENGSFVFVRHTHKRHTTLTMSLSVRRVVERKDRTIALVRRRRGDSAFLVFVD